jgi:hypothetical protein
MTCFHTNFHSIYNNPFNTSNKPKAKYKFCTDAMLLFAILQESTLTKATYFTKLKHISQQNVWILHCMTQVSPLPHRFVWSPCHNGSWDSTVSTATGYRMNDREVRVHVLVVNNFFMSSRLVLGTIQPPIEWVLGTSTLGGKTEWGTEAGHSTPASATSTKWDLNIHSPPHIFVAWFLIG